ncbi:MAG: acyl carrier protein [Terracidiphilus sp.]|jgi:acyl carrier protein
MNKVMVEAVSTILKIKPEAVSLETSQENTPSWDSLAHLRLILEIEYNLGIRFSSQDIPQLTSVAALNEAISKLGR